MKNSVFQQIELCKSCEFWEGELNSDGWCYMFEDMPEYRCMTWEEQDEKIRRR